MPDSISLAARNRGLRLAGELWLLPGTPRAVVLMVPGSGPSDRHNDVFFPPIRDALLERRVAVASFDKRGVGQSTGDWLSAGIEDQAGDARAGIDAISAEPSMAGIPTGLFGHSQGGWVVVEAAAQDPRIAFVITSSGPGVSPAEQERHGVEVALKVRGAPGAIIDTVLAEYDEMFVAIRQGVEYSSFAAWVEADPLRRDRFATLSEVAFVPGDDRQWAFARLILDYDPRPALRRIDRPVLALFGAADQRVPVEASVAAYRSWARSVEIEVFPGADHRCQVGDPPRMAPGYLERLGSWITEVA